MVKSRVLAGCVLAALSLSAASVSAADKYCSSGGTYYCALKVNDPATSSDCDRNLDNAFIDGRNMQDPYVPLSVESDPDWTYHPWEIYSCSTSQSDRNQGVSETCSYVESWTNPNANGGHAQAATVYTYACLPCKEDEIFNAEFGAGVCQKKICPENCDNPATPHPIDPITGAKEYTHTDYRGHQAYPLSFSRYYSSFGRGWLYSYSQSLNLIDDSTIIAKRPDSNSVHFSRIDGQWQANRQPAWQLRFDDSVTPARYYLTRNNIIETYNTDGWLTAIRNSAGQGVDLSYSTDTLTVTLANINPNSDAGELSQSLIITLDFKDKPLGQGRADSPQLVSLLAPNGAEFKYAYDGSRLTHVQYPDDTPGAAGENIFGEDNPVRTYLYERLPFLEYVTGIIDENGVRISNVAYDSIGRAISSGLTDGIDTFSVDYSYQNYGDDQRVTVTNPLGKNKVIHFVEHNGSRVISQIEGKASANCLGANKHFSYDDRGLLQSKTDWFGNSTHYERDERGRVVVRTEAAGSPEERVITTEWHPVLSLPVTKTEPERVIRFSYDAEGRLLNKSISPRPAQ